MWNVIATNSRRIIGLVVLLSVLVAATACGGAAPAASSPTSLDTGYANALNARSILLLGTVRLEAGTGNSLTKDQAAKMLPLWQASKSLIASGTASQAEIDAITNQILAALTPEQVKAINAMRLVQADMQAFNQSLGVTAPSGASGSGMPGQGQALSPAERATRQAQNSGASGNMASMDYLIGILQKKAGK